MRKTKNRAFQCTGFPGCEMTFTRSEHLARHVRKHTGERPFQCTHCERTFSRMDNLRQHQHTVHSYEGCGSRISKKNDLKTNKEKVKEEDLLTQQLPPPRSSAPFLSSLPFRPHRNDRPSPIIVSEQSSNSSSPASSNPSSAFFTPSGEAGHVSLVSPLSPFMASRPYFPSNQPPLLSPLHHQAVTYKGSSERDNKPVGTKAWLQNVLNDEKSEKGGVKLPRVAELGL